MRDHELAELLRQVTETGIVEPYRMRIKQEAARRFTEAGVEQARAYVAWALETLKRAAPDT